MHTQFDTAQVITGRGADYVMTVKGNMLALYRQLKKLPRVGIPAVSSVSTDHGSRARRTIKNVPGRTGGDVHRETRRGQAVPSGCRRPDERCGGQHRRGGMREEAAAIRANLEEIAGD